MNSPNRTVDRILETAPGAPYRSQKSKIVTWSAEYGPKKSVQRQEVENSGV